MPKYYTAGIIRRDDQFLLLHHIKRNAWFFPGGKPEGEESLEACLARELREEIGIEVRKMEFHDTYFRMLDNIQHVGFFFNVTDWTGTPWVREPVKHSGLLWMTLDGMSKFVVPRPEMGIALWYADQIRNLTTNV